MPDRNRVVCLGEALVDFVSEEPVERLTDSASFAPRFGGSQANIAVGAARFGASAALAGCAGTDPWGRWLRETLAREGVDVALFELHADVQTQHAFVAVSPDEPTFSFFGRTPRGCMPVGEELRGRVTEGPPGVLVFGSDTLIAGRDREVVADLGRLARSRNWQVLFDPNLRVARWRDEGLMLSVATGALEEVTVVKANSAEAIALTGRADPFEAARALCSLGPRIALVTAGGEGAILAAGDAAPERVPAVHTRILDATGAGDAVAAVVAAALARGGGLTAGVVELAMQVAARVVTERGALAGLPSAAEAARMLDRHIEDASSRGLF